MSTWFVLSNAEGLILAVYGSALRDMAIAKRNEIERETHCTVYLHEIVGNRPSVYGTISMRNVKVS